MRNECVVDVGLSGPARPALSPFDGTDRVERTIGHGPECMGRPALSETEGSKAPCERPAPAVWLLPVILGGGCIWAVILFAIF